MVNYRGERKDGTYVSGQAPGREYSGEGWGAWLEQQTEVQVSTAHSGAQVKTTLPQS